jgi:BlaI family penicillinase repressor
MKELTKAEEEIMQVLWELESAFVKEIIEKMPETKPKYNTVSTFVRILQEKGFVSHEIHGKSHKYYPIVSKESYTKTYMSGLVKNYFGGSYKQMVSFFTDEENLSLTDLEELIKELKK